MNVYIGIFFFIFFQLFYDMLVFKGKKIIYCCIGLFIILFVGLRNCGFDFDIYERYFPILHNFQIKEIFNHNLFEPVIILLYKLSKNFELLIFVVAFFSLFIKFHVFYNYSIYPFLSLFIYLCCYMLLSDMGQIRQGLALSFSFLAYFHRKDHKFWLFFFLAFFSHYSAVIIILYKIIPSKLYTLKIYISIFLLAVALSIFILPLLNIFCDYLPSFIGLKLRLYMNVAPENKGISINLLIIRLLFFYLAYYFLKCNCNITIHKPFSLLNIYFFAIVLYILLSPVPQLSGRGISYLSIFDIFLIPYTIKYIKKNINKIIYISIVIFYCTYPYFSFLIKWNQYIPYKSVVFNFF